MKELENSPENTTLVGHSVASAVIDLCAITTIATATKQNQIGMQNKIQGG